MSGVEKLRQCMKDRVRGSMDITIGIIEASYVVAKEGLSKDRLIKLLEKIVKNQPSMALLINISFQIIDLLKKDQIDEILLLKDNLLKATNALSEKASKLLDNKSVCTISNSKEVFDSIVKSHCKTVYVGVAHPKKEGELFALNLKNSGKKVVIFEDNNYLFGAKMCDVFLSGADAIFDEAFVNKSQTFSLCLFAKYFNKSFYLLANRYKYLNADLKDYYKILQMPRREVTKKDLDVYNVYFEEIPLDLVTPIAI